MSLLDDALIEAVTNNYRLCASGLRPYVKSTWDILEPRTELLYNWHHDLIIEYLEACFMGQITRLCINVPPRYMKSNLVSVAFPTWGWIRRPETRWIFSSYSQPLSTKLSLDRREIIKSEWYQRGYSRAYQLTDDQDAKTQYQNTKRGAMLATSMHGSVTGFGADFIVIDDPHNPQGAESDQVRESVIRNYDRTFSNRLNDKKRGVIIVIMQRLHQNDLSGHILAQGDWEHLKIPGEFTRDVIYSFPLSNKFKEVKAGELLHPERENRGQIEKQKIALGSYGFAGQYLQEPSPPGGGIFKRSWVKHWTTLPAKFDEFIISADMTFKETSDSDFVVLQLWGRIGAQYYLIDQVRSRMDFTTTIRTFVNFCAKWPKAFIKLVEDKANGTAVINTLQKSISGIIPVNPKDSKQARAASVSPAFEAGNVLIPPSSSHPWVGDYIEELVSFPRSRNDDQVDATTQAINRFQNRPSGNFVDISKQTGQSIVNDLITGDKW